MITTMMTTWKLWDCHIARIKASNITQYYLFPHWLSSNPGCKGQGWNR